jgi:hypothetical protein
MTRIFILVLVLGATMALPALTATAAAPTTASASVKATASACPSTIRMGGKRFAFYRHRVTCRGGRTAVRRLYASRGHSGTPRGFKCRSASRFRKNAGCVNRTKSRYFGYSR